MDRRFLLLAGLALLGGCASAAPPALAPAATSFAELEPIHAARAGREALTITVASNGCTAKEHFAFFVERQGQAVRLAFGRKQLDRCQSLAAGRVDLSFSYEELGVEGASPLFLLNPLTAWAGPA